MDHDKAARRALLVAKALKHHASVIHNPAPVMGNPPPPVARYGTMAPHLTQIAPVARAEGGEVGEQVQISPEQRTENLGKFIKNNHPEVPHIVYHGTTAEDFHSFRPNIRKNEQLGFGIHHSEDPSFASRYANDPHTARKGKFPRVYASHLSIKNPLMADSFVKQGTPEFDLAKKLAGSKFFTQKDEDGIPTVYLQNAIDSANPKIAEKLIREAGYDGVRYQARLIRQQLHGQYSSAAQSPSWIVFDPSQIKSATGNNGNYDKNSTDMGKSSGGFIDPAFTDADETAQMKYIQDPNLAMPANQVDQDIEGGAYARGGEVSPHPALGIPGVHIRTAEVGEPIFHGEK